MSKYVHKISATKHVQYKGRNRFEHWYVDNQVYFITARCRERYPAFASDAATQVFWDRWEHYMQACSFVPWIISVIPSHYHVLGYCREGRLFGQMMRKVHGSIAKLVNDVLPQRRVPFWREAGKQDYFDGCIRNETQCRRAYRYIQRQSLRHGIRSDWRDHPNTRVYIDLDRGVKRALEIGAFLPHIPYKRYQKRR